MSGSIYPLKRGEYMPTGPVLALVLKLAEMPHCIRDWLKSAAVRNVVYAVGSTRLGLQSSGDLDISCFDDSGFELLDLIDVISGIGQPHRIAIKDKAGGALLSLFVNDREILNVWFTPDRVAFDLLDAMYRRAVQTYSTRRIGELKVSMPKEQFYHAIGITLTADLGRPWSLIPTGAMVPR